MISAFHKKRKIKLGGKRLLLHLSDRHEKKYYEMLTSDRKDIDQLIAETYVRPGDVVLDAGANIGFSSLLFLENGASMVHAFEPAPELFLRLKTLEGGNLKAYNVALSDSGGQAEMILSDSHNQGHTLNSQWQKIFPTVYAETKRTCLVNKEKLDTLFPKIQFNFMKVDIEGSEELFLRGCSGMLTNAPPRVMQIEIYEEVFASVYNELTKYFKHIKRTVFNKKNCTLELLDPGENINLALPDIEENPPTYLCTNHFLLFKNDNPKMGEVQNDYLILDEFKQLSFGSACLQKVLDELDFRSVLDVGSGSGQHAEIFSKYGKTVTQVDFGKSCYFMNGSTDRKIVIGDYLHCTFDKQFDLVWACHVLEHQPNVNLFLRKIHSDLRDEGYLAITVPPLRNEVVGGHLTIWNAGLLLYNLVLAGFNCKQAKILQYGYNISVILQKEAIVLPALDYDKGDIDKLKNYLPDGLKEPFDGNISKLNW